MTINTIFFYWSSSLLHEEKKLLLNFSHYLYAKNL